MKFVYPFQKVLDVKTNEKKEAESQLSLAIGELNEAERTMSDLMLEKHRLQQRMSEEAMKGRTMAEMVAGQQYIDHLDERIGAAKRRLEAAERRANELRERLVDRTMDEKVWLKAKDKAQVAHRAVVERREQYELDEMATMRSRLAR
ncbi:flagellar export protein FliJ [Paenibacillus sp.]|uniref:flagellar export protein FliJ n=1 Tax=Paenibacillus sp. TaxID=58172 RepID=UPI002D3B9816|nr:flagellar export protein FliJ [Paenibacillus sp.]HZG57889.1 flagellar export protein FliJ [Paenibacillus sp.]